jgi:hypothetical protein
MLKARPSMHFGVCLGATACVTLPPSFAIEIFANNVSKDAVSLQRKEGIKKEGLRQE